MLALLTLLACQDTDQTATVAPQLEPPTGDAPPAEAPAEDGAAEPPARDPELAAGSGDPGSAGVPAGPGERTEEDDGSPYGSGFPDPPLTEDPPDEEWWGPAAGLTLDADGAKAILIGEWTQVREPSLEQHIKLLGLSMEEPVQSADALQGAGLSAEEAAFVLSMAEVVVEADNRTALVKEHADRSFLVTLTITADTVTINTNEAARTTPYAVKSVYNDQVAFSSTGPGGKPVTTLVTFLDSDRIRVQPDRDEPVILRFAR